MENAELVVKTELEKYESEEQALEVLSAKLQKNPQFAKFLEAQKSFNELQTQVWKNIETVMIENNIKSIETDKVLLTIAERTSFNIDLSLLPSKYIKKVPDTAKILGTFRLEGKPVKGTTPKYTQYLVKRIR